MSETPFEPLLQLIEPHAQLLRTWPVTGGVSAQVTAVEYVRADGLRKQLIVRQHGQRDLARNPQIAADEFRLLQQLHACGLAVPKPLYVGQAGSGFTTPVIAMEFIEGTTDPGPIPTRDCVRQMAAQLAQIHRIDPIVQDLAFLPVHATSVERTIRQQPEVLYEAFDEALIRATLAAVWPFPQHNQLVVLHGDYWPGNLLWNDGQLAAVIDWEDAAIGDPLADLANTRLELLWAWGQEAMQQFTDEYAALAPLEYAELPYWDLYSALRPIGKITGWGLDPATEQTMREQHHTFVLQACARLPSLP